MKTFTYYAYALNTQGKIGQLFVMKTPGLKLSQLWTGKVYPSLKAACADIAALNGC